MLKKLIFSALLILSCQAFAAHNNNYLFFQFSPQGNLKKLDNNNYILTLDNSPEFVNYFADRPARKAGVVALAKFISLWSDKNIKDNFDENPPNVAMTMITRDGSQQDFVALISKPNFANGKTSYHISTLDDKSVQTGDLTHIALFFDQISWSPGGF